MPKVESLKRLDGVLLDGLDYVRTAYQVLDEIKREPGGLTELRLRKRSRPCRRAKKLLEEVLPIAGYVEATYAPTQPFKVRWRDWNGGYDAEIEGAQAGRPKYIEVTTAQHPLAYLQREHWALEAGGFSADGVTRDPNTGKTISVPVAVDAKDAEAALRARIRKAIEDKASIPNTYPRETALVVLWDSLDVTLEQDMERVAVSLASLQHPFLEFYVVSPVGYRAWPVR